MSSIYDWDKTAANNASADGDINWAEGQASGTVNNSARQMMAREAEWRDDLNGTLEAGGTANAITITTNSGFTSYASGRKVIFKAGATNTGAVTLSVNSIGSKAVRWWRINASGDQTLTGGEIQEGGIYEVIYDADANSSAGAWILMNQANNVNSSVGMAAGAASADVSVTLSRTSTGAVSGKFSTDSGKMWIGTLGSLPFEIRVNGTTKYQAGESASLFSGIHSFGAAYSATGANAGWTHRADGVVFASRETTSTASVLVFYNPNGGVGQITTVDSATIYATSSDGRRKENKRDFNSGAIIDALEAWLYDWKTGGTGYGVIAQDARKVFPDAISEGEDGYLFADYSKFVPVLLREVKELRRRVGELEAAFNKTDSA